MGLTVKSSTVSKDSYTEQIYYQLANQINNLESLRGQLSLSEAKGTDHKVEQGLFSQLLEALSLDNWSWLQNWMPKVKGVELDYLTNDSFDLSARKRFLHLNNIGQSREDFIDDYVFPEGNFIQKEVFFHKKEVYDFVAYKLHNPTLGQANLFGFTIIQGSSANHIPFSSHHDFFKNAPEELIHAFMKFINNFAHKNDYFKNGYRLISNHGLDSWAWPVDIMQFILAGGSTLSKTVSNVWGSQQKVINMQDQNNIFLQQINHLDYQSAFPHEEELHKHCTEIMEYSDQYIDQAQEAVKAVIY